MLVCLAGVGLPAHAGAAEPVPGEDSVGIQLLDAPVSRRDDPRALRYIVDHLPPGTVINRRVLVVNNSGVPRHVDLYPASAKVEHGHFVFGADRAANELTSWITVERPELDLAPGEQAPVGVTITVPPKASAGERYAVLWAAVTSDEDRGGNVRLVNRVGVRVYLDVGPGGEPPSAFTFGRVTASRDEQGRPSVTVEVDNTGGRALDLSGTADLTGGPGGMRAGPFDVRAGTTLGPGQSGTVSVRFPRDLSDGPWTVAIHLVSGTVTNDTTARIAFTGSSQATESGGFLSRLSLPVWGAVIVVVLLAFVTVLVFKARRTGRRVLR